MSKKAVLNWKIPSFITGFGPLDSSQFNSLNASPSPNLLGNKGQLVWNSMFVHFFLELLAIEQSREEMRLFSILSGLRLPQNSDDREFNAGIEVVSRNGLVIPSTGCVTDHPIVGFALQTIITQGRSCLVLDATSLQVVKLDGFLVKDGSHAVGLDSQPSRKNKVEEHTHLSVCVAWRE